MTSRALLAAAYALAALALVASTLFLWQTWSCGLSVVGEGEAEPRCVGRPSPLAMALVLASLVAPFLLGSRPRALLAVGAAEALAGLVLVFSGGLVGLVVGILHATAGAFAARSRRPRPPAATLVARR